MAAAVESARATTLHAARLRDRGLPFGREASIAKLVATDNAMKVTTDAVQVLGGYGYTRDFPVERYMREAKVMQIFEGTNQIQRMVIGRHLDKGLGRDDQRRRLRHRPPVQPPAEHRCVRAVRRGSCRPARRGARPSGRSAWARSRRSRPAPGLLSTGSGSRATCLALSLMAHGDRAVPANVAAACAATGGASSTASTCQRRSGSGRQ